MNIPANLQQPHVEINEDGVKLNHPGYQAANCVKCGKECLAMVGAVSPNCGLHDRLHSETA